MLRPCGMPMCVRTSSDTPSRGGEREQRRMQHHVTRCYPLLRHATDFARRAKRTPRPSQMFHPIARSTPKEVENVPECSECAGMCHKKFRGCGANPHGTFRHIPAHPPRGGVDTG